MSVEEQRPKCGTKPCNERATQRVYWPGQMIDLCEDCTRRAKKIAANLEFSLTVEPLP